MLIVKTHSVDVCRRNESLINPARVVSSQLGIDACIKGTYQVYSNGIMSSAEFMQFRIADTRIWGL